MKKLLSILLAVALTASLCACAPEKPQSSQATTVADEAVTTVSGEDNLPSTTEPNTEDTEATAEVTTDAPETDAPATEAPATDAPATEAPKNDTVSKLYGTWEGKYDVGAIAVQYVQQELGVENLEDQEGLISLTIAFNENGEMQFAYNADEFVDVIIKVMTTKECLDYFIDLSAEASEVTREEFIDLMKLVTDDLYAYLTDALVASYTDPTVVAVFSQMLNQTYTFEVEDDTLCLNNDLEHVDYTIALEGDNLTLTSEQETLNLTRAK